MITSSDKSYSFGFTSGSQTPSLFIGFTYQTINIKISTLEYLLVYRLHVGLALEGGVTNMITVLHLCVHVKFQLDISLNLAIILTFKIVCGFKCWYSHSGCKVFPNYNHRLICTIY